MFSEEAKIHLSQNRFLDSVAVVGFVAVFGWQYGIIYAVVRGTSRVWSSVGAGLLDLAMEKMTHA